jgi:hypothetical protein
MPSKIFPTNFNKGTLPTVWLYCTECTTVDGCELLSQFKFKQTFGGKCSWDVAKTKCWPLSMKVDGDKCGFGQINWL